MRTRNITHEQWQPFFDDFTYLYRGEHVNVETIPPGGGVQSQLCDMPLVGVSAAKPVSAQEQQIEVVARKESGSYKSHFISKPSIVHVAEEDAHAIAPQ